MIILCGKSGSGKTLIETMLKEIGAKSTISVTTRSPREGEINGKDYYFVNEEEFKQMIEEDKLAEYTCYNGNFYGTLYSELENSDVAVMDLEGLKNIKKKRDLKTNICSFYINVPERVRKKRMKERGDSSEKIKNRIQFDNKHFKTSDVFNYADFIIDNKDEESLIQAFTTILIQNGISFFHGKKK